MFKKKCKFINIFVIILVISMTGFAFPSENNPRTEPPEIPDDVRPLNTSYYRGYNWTTDEFGDSIIRFYMNPITIFPPMKFKNKKEEDFYWRTVRNVRITLPYAKMIRETLIETYEYIETFPTQKEREDYLKKMEKDLFKEYKPVLKKLSRSQANLLVKLIQRETDQSSYDILKAFLGSFRATFWQGFGRLFGVSLKGKFDPKKNRDDEIINRIATNIEQGVL